MHLRIFHIPTSLIKVCIDVSLVADWICIYVWPHMDFTWTLVLHVESRGPNTHINTASHSITRIHEKFCDLTISDPQQLFNIRKLIV